MDDYLSYKIPNILYLDGIRFSDYEPLEDKSDKKILENIDISTLNLSKQPFSKIMITVMDSKFFDHTKLSEISL